MRHRLECAKMLREDYRGYRAMLGKYPLELVSSDDISEDSPEFFRAVIDTPEELDLLIKLPEQEVVTVMEALSINRSLVYPRPDKRAELISIRGLLPAIS